MGSTRKPARRHEPTGANPARSGESSGSEKAAAADPSRLTAAKDPSANECEPDKLAGEANDLSKAMAVLDADAGSVSPLWIGFLTFGTYLAIAIGSVTHRQLFLE